ncbi:MAG: murein biosynthesis integral membrane protein MurJ [Desulfovibrionaceae bacterium]|nr:murein biosynthesis integral membrane protein MurJ [Desulfovibrionaceae bacterium]
MGITTTQKMGVAALIMAGSVFLSRLMGLVRDKVVSWQFGAGAEPDVYFTAFVVPDFLNHLLAGAYISITLIPLLAMCFKENEEDGRRFFSAVFCWAAAGITLLTFLAWVAAPMLAPWVGPGFGAEGQARLVTFLRIILPAQIFFLPGACLSAVLYIRRQFMIPALTPLIYNAGIIAGGLLWPGDGMEGFCWGVLAGAALGAFFLPLWGVWRGGIRLSLCWRHKSLKKLALMALPLMLGLSVTALDEQFVRLFGSMAGEGAVSLLNYARRIMMVPVGVVAQAAGVASFPFLAALAAKGDTEGFEQTLKSALRGSVYVVLPLCGLMMLLSAPILGFLFEGGRFTAAQTAGAAPLLQIMLLSVPFWTIQQVVGRAFYARQDTLTPAVVGTLATLAALCVYPQAAQQWGAVGVAVVTAGSIVLYTVALCLVWKRGKGHGTFEGLGSPVWAGSALTCAAAAAGWGALSLLQPCCVSLAARLSSVLPLSSALISHSLRLAIGTLIFCLVYVALAAFAWPDALRIRRKNPVKKP